MTSLTVVDLIREGRFETAVIRMQELCRIQDPEVPVDAAEVQAQFKEMRARLAKATYEPPEPVLVTPNGVRVVVELVSA